jgi:hypothetical protein
MNSTSNYTLDFLSWAPPPPKRYDNATSAIAYLAFAMISAFAFALMMSKFQQRLREHQRRIILSDNDRV